MAVDFRFIGKFVESGGLEDLNQPPYNAGQLRSRFTRYSFPQATSSGGALAAMPTDIGPGTLLYRKDLADKAGVSEADLTRDWDSYIAAGKKIQAATGAYLLADAADLRDIVLRVGLKDGDGIYFDKQGNCLVDSPRFVKAFELGRAVRAGRAGCQGGRLDQRMGSRIQAGPHRNADDGRVAHGPPQELARSRQPRQVALGAAARRPVRLVRRLVLRHPEESGAQSGGLGVHSLHDHQQGDRSSIRCACSTAFPALLEAQQDPAMDEPIEYLGGQKARALWRDIAAKVPAISVNKLDTMATDVIRDEFEQVVAHGKDIKAALADARSLIERRSRRR